MLTDYSSHDCSKQSGQIEAKRYEISSNDDEAVRDHGRVSVSLDHNIRGWSKKLRELKTGECNLTGKTFGGFIRHFIFSSDKIYMHTSPGHLNVIGLTYQKKN